MVFFRSKYATDKDHKNNKHLKKECANLVSNDIILLSGRKIPGSDGKIPRIVRTILESGEKIPVSDGKIPRIVGTILGSGENIPGSDGKIPRIVGIILGSGENIPGSGGIIPRIGGRIIWGEIKKSRSIVGFKKNSSYIFFVSKGTD
jgi:hypothetical protein